MTVGEVSKKNTFDKEKYLTTYRGMAIITMVGINCALKVGVFNA